jgi:hypothetical protein
MAASFIIIETASESEAVARIDAHQVNALDAKLFHGQVVLAPLLENNTIVHFCRVCHETHALMAMLICQHCTMPICSADSVVTRRDLNMPSVVASVPYVLRSTAGHHAMSVASCLSCFAKQCWSHNIHFHHPRLAVQAPCTYAKRWRHITSPSVPLSSEARVVFGELLASYELAQRSNCDLQERITMLERERERTTLPVSLLVGNLDALLGAYSTNLEQCGKATQYTVFDRSNGYDIFPSPGSSPTCTSPGVSPAVPKSYLNAIIASR